MRAARAPLPPNFATEQAVYGVILVAGMIVVSGAKSVSSWSVFVSVVSTVIVFWAAHVYAGTVAYHGDLDGKTVSLGTAFKESLNRSLGLLVAAVPPSILLLLGTLDLIDDDVAIWGALISGVIVLMILGYIAFWRRRSSMLVRIAGALSTATFGAVMILLKALVH